MNSSRAGRVRRTGRRAAVAALLALAVVLPASGQSNVQVDRDVLDSLGAAPEKPKKAAPKPPAAKAKPVPPPKAAAVPPPPEIPPPQPAAPPPSKHAAPPPATPPAADFVATPPPPPAAPPPPPVTDTARSEPPPDRAAAAPEPPPPPAPSGQQVRLTPVPPPAAPVPPPVRTVGEMAARIPFPNDVADLGAEARTALDRLVPRLEEDERLRVEVQGYASPGADVSQARRIALARALAVRSYLVDKGIKTSRVDVRALGSRPDGEPADRVDLLLAAR